MGKRSVGPRFIARDCLYLLGEDWRALDRRLRMEFPGLVFVGGGGDGAAAWRDFEERLRARGDRRAVRPGHPDYAAAVRIWNALRVDALAPRPNYAWIRAKIALPGWRPRWRRRERGFELELTRWPARTFTIMPGIRHDRRLDGPMPAALLPGRQAADFRILAETKFQGVYYPGDTAQLRFLRRVRAIIDSMTDNRTVGLSPGDMAVKFVIEKGGMARVAPAAARWALAHPRHFLGYLWEKPIDWLKRARPRLAGC